jgi:hypothetical protein
MATPTLVNHLQLPNTGIPGGSIIANNTGITSRVWVRLPDPALAGNLLVIAIRCSNGITINAPTDDCGNTWQICTGTACTDSTNHAQGVMYYANNVIQGTRQITLTFTNYLSPTFGQTMFSCSIGQWCNMATSGVYDGGSGGAVTSSTTWNAGSGFTTTANGDLIICCGWTTTNAPTVTTWTAAGSQTLLAADIIDSFSQGSSSYLIQSTAGAINPGFTLGVAHAGICMAAAFQATTAASSGTPRPAGIQIVRIQGQSQYLVASSATINFQMPCSGNLLVSAGSFSSTTLPVINSQSTNWTTLDSQTQSANGYQSLQCLPNVTSSPTYSGTVTTSSATQLASFFLYDIIGAATSPIGNVGSGWSYNDTGLPGTVAGPSFTPSQANSLVIILETNGVATIHGICGDPSFWFFDYGTYPALDDTTNVLSAQNQASPFCENNALVHVFTRNTSPIQPVFASTGVAFAGGVNDMVCLVGELLAATPTPTQYTIAPAPTSPVTLAGEIGVNGWYDWQAPYGATNVTWEFYGPGGSGANVTTASRGGGGGGGGGYTSSTQPAVSSTAQNLYVFFIGGAGWNNAGTVFAGTGTQGAIQNYDDTGTAGASANSGVSAAANATASGAGASTTGAGGIGTGSVVRSGGHGGAGGSSVGGGGGGGAGGSTGNGGVGAAGAASGSAAGGTSGGGLAGVGGLGCPVSTPAGGGAGNNYGAGAGGAYKSSTSEPGSSGGVGAVVIKWTMPHVPAPPFPGVPNSFLAM